MLIIIKDDMVASILDETEYKKWSSHVQATATMAHVHGCNPFDTNPIKWNEKPMTDEIRNKINELKTLLQQV